jgi:hypothetical protein
MAMTKNTVDLVTYRAKEITENCRRSWPDGRRAIGIGTIILSSNGQTTIANLKFCSGSTIPQSYHVLGWESSNPAVIDQGTCPFQLVSLLKASYLYNATCERSAYMIFLSCSHLLLGLMANFYCFSRLHPNAHAISCLHEIHLGQ